MTLTIDLHKMQENDIRALADAHGVTLEEEAKVLLRRAIQREKNKKVLALLDRWKAEDAQMTEEEKQTAGKNTELLLEALQENRNSVGDD